MIRLTELHGHACRASSTLREVLVDLNRSPYLFQIVVDDERRVLGTITDGDVRRALLAGVELDEPATRGMRPGGIVGVLGADEINRNRLRSIKGLLAFLPVLDGDSRLAEIWIAPKDESVGGSALVMAGGFGRRLGDRTRTVPKPLLRVGGKPIIDHVIDAVIGAGFDTVHVAVHHFADQIESHVRARADSRSIRFLREDAPLGTAGAIGLMPDSTDLLVINADLVTRVDLAALVSYHRRQGFDATIATARHETSIPYGIVRHDDDGAILSIEEKPTLRHFVLAGIYYLSPRVTALAPRREACDMPELLNLARQNGLKLGMFPLHEYWRDIGRPVDFDLAQSEHPATDDPIAP